MELQGKRAVVTGAGVRLGRAVALALARAGVSVAVHYSSSEAGARETRDEILSIGVESILVPADFRKPVAAARSVFEQVQSAWGTCDLLINSAAIFEPGTLLTTDEANFDRHFAINLKAPLFLCREFRLQLPADRSGQIVNIADWRGGCPIPGHLAYTLTKSGLVALTKILAVELAPNIRVNAVAPGTILPPPGSETHDQQRIDKNVPLRMHGEASDIAEAVLYLLNSNFITGEVLHVTGGEQLT